MIVLLSHKKYLYNKETDDLAHGWRHFRQSPSSASDLDRTFGDSMIVEYKTNIIVTLGTPLLFTWLLEQEYVVSIDCSVIYFILSDFIWFYFIPFHSVPFFRSFLVLPLLFFFSLKLYYLACRTQKLRSHTMSANVAFFLCSFFFFWEWAW